MHYIFFYSFITLFLQITFGNDQNFTFDNVFGTTSTQSDLYDDCVANLVEGFKKILYLQLM